ncbi:hypothetical protein [Flaviflagellibacter deserti]|uniref:Uncharacterized protein n=1 Tax=Flaviflagellibacter deserti TaxID=2267266 RepID=A0ABV9Z0G2_9HYPH
MKRLGLLLLAVGLSCGQAQASTALMDQTPVEIQAGIEAKHPVAYLIVATKLFESSRKDEAVFWFYLGQLRYRTHLMARPKLDPTGDAALFSSLFSSMGPAINRYAYADPGKLTKTIDRVLAWDDAHDDTFTSKKTYAAERESIRKGLIELREYNLAQAERINTMRSANGLENH